MFQFAYVSPESLGISSAAIAEFIDRARLRSNELHSLQVLRHGKRCFFGCWAPYRKDTAHIMFSFSKSLTSSAIGFAEQEGLLSLDEKLIDIFPDKCPEVISDNRKVSFDDVVRTMYETGKDLSNIYRETSEGGLAKMYVNKP